ncbi:asparagine synthase (glutamine-hydrolyzing) [Bacteroidia bacterium]|nr:asparagine synthase (glutamine-hydrolyzing) [Bacteroidia bacterium]
MCGINGFLSSINLGEDFIFNMNNKIHHRGPDDEGTYFQKIEDKFIGLGMRRLSIIDLESGKQPITSKDGNLVIIFNGEIYNYQVLKNELIDNFNAVFTTSSDTEVILKMYEYYGKKSFSRLDGMFAFTILDKNIGKVFIARDFFGEKPLYYQKTSNYIIWGSELKSIVYNCDERPDISKKALSIYFQLTYIPAPYTIYKGIRKLLANHYLEIDIKTSTFTESKISRETQQKNIKHTFNEAKKNTFDLVKESINSRSVSDVPIGTFLSGGVDSSIVSLCLSQDRATSIDTFSLGFQKKTFDESDKSRLVAKQIKSNHHEFIVDSKSMEEDIENVILNYDEPFADSSALPTYLVSKLTSKYVKVALTGDGGDEVFGGYNKYYIGKLNNIYTKFIPKTIHDFTQNSFKKILYNKSDKRGSRYKLKRLLESINYDGDYYKGIISLSFQEEELTSLLLEGQKSLHTYIDNKNKYSLKDFRDIDKRLSLEGDMLVKVDRASMLSSIECRAPFLNKKLWNFTNSLPDNYLIKGWNKKYILKRAFEDYFPDKFLESSKQGFGVPVGDWLRTILRKELKGYIDVNFLLKQNLFNSDFIIPLVKNHLDSREDNTFKVWSFYCFQKWYTKIYLDL